MPEFGPIQSNFTTGEISPRLYGRVDLPRYQHAVALMKNFRVISHGGATRRPGTRYVATVKTPSAGKVRLIPFSFSDSQEYILELGDLYARFYTLNGQLINAGSPVELVTPWAIADVFGLRFTQKADTMYIFHKNYACRKLQRTSATSFSLTQVDFTDGPYYPIGFSSQLPTTTGITITPSATTGSITLTASAAIFVAGHVGSQWRIKDSAAWGWVKVSAFTSSTVVTAVVQAASTNGAAGALDGVAATTSWREGQINTVSGFARAAVFHQQRLWVGGMAFTPASLIGSFSGDFENMSDSKSDGTVLDTSAVNYIVSSDKLNVIRWLKPSRNLIVGTAGAEHEVVGGSSSTPAITPTNVLIRGQSVYGSPTNDLELRAANALLFAEKNSRKIREFTYDLNTDSYSAPDITILAEHLFPPSTNLADAAFQSSFDQQLWFVRSDGVLLGAAYDRTENVVGWFQFVTGNMATDGVESVAVINHPDGDRQQVWVAVRRTINGVVQRFVEYLDDKNNPYHTLTSPPAQIYNELNTDAAATADGTQATTLTLSAKSGGAITATAGAAVFTAGMVGGYIRVNEVPNTPAGQAPPSFNGIAQIVAFVDATHVTLDNTVTYQGQAFGFLSYVSGTWAIGQSTYGGLTYLNGMTVDIVGDGAVQPTVVVSGGQVTLQSPAAMVEIGLHYDSEMDTLRPEIKTQKGTSQGLKKKWAVVVVRLLNTLGVTIGMLRDPNDPIQFLDTIPFRSMSLTASPTNAPPPLFSGDIVKTQLGIDRAGEIIIKQLQPLPCTVTMMSGNLEVADEL